MIRDVKALGRAAYECLVRASGMRDLDPWEEMSGEEQAAWIACADMCFMLGVQSVAKQNAAPPLEEGAYAVNGIAPIGVQRTPNGHVVRVVRRVIGMSTGEEALHAIDALVASGVLSSEAPIQITQTCIAEVSDRPPPKKEECNA